MKVVAAPTTAGLAAEVSASPMAALATVSEILPVAEANVDGSVGVNVAMSV